LNKEEKIMPQIRVSLGFARSADHQLEETAGEVIAGMTGNASYPTPPVTMAALQTALTEFTAAQAAQASGGPPATAVKEAKGEALIDLLRLVANSVQGVVDALEGSAADKLALLLSSGFEAVATARTRSPLATPGVPAVENGISGQLILRVRPVKNAKSYEVRYALADGVWKMGGIFTGARAMPINGLTPGQMYTLQMRAIGGTTGYSGWSDPVQRMSL
jgi:hypothetical protein